MMKYIHIICSLKIGDANGSPSVAHSPLGAERTRGDQAVPAV
ncbi:MAG: hypothetical protein WEC84_03380 [Candidatus Andersenbacteria bacterium]